MEKRRMIEKGIVMSGGGSGGYVSAIRLTRLGSCWGFILWYPMLQT
jgi:pyruvate/2-oxoglutarate dehydrogenase complex dihydrolipoamide dehydrogenase (E3) component